MIITYSKLNSISYKSINNKLKIIKQTMNPNIYRKPQPQKQSYQSMQSNRANKISQYITKQSWLGTSQFQQQKQKSQTTIKNTSYTRNKQQVINTINQYDQFNRIRLGSIQKEKENKNSQSPLTKLANSFYKIEDSKISNSNNKNKQTQRSPTQLIQDIFRGIGLDHFPTSKAYYSRQTQQSLSQILSNRTKLQNYIKKLSSLISTSLSSQVSKNYQILLILLIHLSEANLQIHHTQSKGLQIKFNRQQLQQKQRQIQKLQKQLQEKNKQAQKIVEEYEGVIRNFNDVIEKLVSQKRKNQY